MDLGLQEKVIVVSGGAGRVGSIGETLLRRLVAEGAIPVILDISERGALYVETIRQNGGEALFCETDLTQPEEVFNAIKTIERKYGAIDAIVNNVGLNDGVGLEASQEQFLDSLKLNLVSYFLVVKYALPLLKKSKGNILNIGSKVALTGQGKTSGYAAAKGGVLGLTREWAVDLLPFDIRCNAIIIAESYTPMYKDWIDGMEDGAQKLKTIVKKIPLENRMTTPTEIADTCLFTISERASHTTGQFIFVDGGYVHLDRALINDTNP